MNNIFSKSNLIIVFIVLIPFLYFFLNSEYMPRDDQFIMLQSAYRLYQGFGLTGSLDDNRNWLEHKDLSKDNYHFITNWPPGFSLFIFFFLKLGLSTDLAPKLFHILFLIIGSLLWLSLLKFYYNEIKFFQKMFFLIIVFFTINFIGDSNLVFWALFPLIIFLIMNIYKNKYYPIILSIIISLLIVFRYQSLFLIIGALLSLVFLYRHSSKKILINSTYIIFIPLITYLIINYFNRTYGGDLFTQKMEYQFGFNFYWFILAIKSFTTELFFLDRILAALLRKFISSRLIELIIDIISIVILSIYCWIIYLAYKKEQLKKLAIIFTIFFISNFLFLLFVSILQSDSQATYTAINVSRYYRVLIVFLVLISFATFKDQLSKISKSYLFILIFLTFISWSLLNIYYFKERENLSSIYNEIRSKVSELAKQTNCKKTFIISMDTFIKYYDESLSYRYLVNPNDLYFSEKTLLIVVNSRLQKKYFYNKTEENVIFRDFNYGDFIKKNDMHNFFGNLYYKVFLPFEKIEY